MRQNKLCVPLATKCTDMPRDDNAFPHCDTGCKGRKLLLGICKNTLGGELHMIGSISYQIVDVVQSRIYNMKNLKRLDL